MIPRFAGRNWSLKLTALFLAVLLWIAVRVEAPDRQSISGVPVQVIVNDAEWTLVGDPDPMSVDVSFSGPMRALLTLGTQPPPLRIELDDITSTDTVLALSRDWVALSAESGVAVDQLQPETIHLTFDRLETVVLPFEVSTVGLLDASLALAANVVAQPRRGRVRGPSRQLAQMSSIPVQALDLTRVGGSGTAQVAVNTSSLGPEITVDPMTVGVQFTVEPKLTRTFVGVVVQLEDSANMEVDPASIDVIVEGAASVVAALTPEDIALVAAVPTVPVALEGLDIAVTARNLPDFVSAQLAVDQVRIRPRSEGEPVGRQR